MNLLLENYDAISKKVNFLNEQIQSAEKEIKSIHMRREDDIPARVATLEEQLVKIDEYMLKIEGFRKLAEKNLESQNVLTIEAPPGYRVNLNRLRSWAMMIDPMSPNDPYAQRVYVVAKCDECFLEQKRQEFTERIEALKSDKTVGLSVELKQLEEKIAGFNAELGALSESDEIVSLAKEVEKANKSFWYESAPEVFKNRTSPAQSISMGAYARPFKFPKEQRQRLKNLFGKFYDDGSSTILLPVELKTNEEFAMTISCAPTRRKQVDRGLQNLALNIINGYPAGENKIYVLDANRFNSESMSPLRQLEGTFALGQIPRNPDQLTSVFEQIASSFPDIDDTLDSGESAKDSVKEYNESSETTKKIPRTTLFLFGWPSAFEGRDRELLQRILTNYERYGVSFVTISYRTGDKKRGGDDNNLPEYAAYNAININMLPGETTIQFPSRSPQRFAWYAFSDKLPESYATSLKENKIVQDTIGSEYTKRYDLVELPAYTRAYKQLELPFGVDGKDNAHSMSFERENFAAYLVGASGSGKSTLLHTMIAGIIRNFHPDNVELWLADFKQLEFKKYMKHCPPHVKYILLDESTELVYDLIDQINKKMMERQQIFGQLGKERLDQIDPRELSKPMPLIFIILDEFSVMSQAISESQAYKLKLQNVLAKGRALGIRFLFSSQTFTKGIAGLTPTAKDQIQQRIAMKGTREEISETLELSANLKTDQVNNWMDALPPYYALVKHRTSADTPPEVKRVNVMYFSDYEPRNAMIDLINSKMTAVEKYSPNDLNAYVDKEPIIVDGNMYASFDEQTFLQHITKLTANSKDYSGDEIFISLGSPRLMEKTKVAALTPETRENVLLVGRDAEQACAAAVVTSAMKSFIAQRQKVRVWAYAKNRLYKAYRSAAWWSAPFTSIEFVEGIDDVCDEIRTLKQNIKDKKSSNELIVLIGMDRICSDFDLIDSNSSVNTPPGETISERKKAREEAAVQSGAVAVTEYDKTLEDLRKTCFKLRNKVREKMIAQGKTAEEIEKVVKAATNKFVAKNPAPSRESFTSSSPTMQAPERDDKPTESKMLDKGAYNAMSDFQYVIKQGSRHGYHFLLYLNSFADLKNTSLKVDFFRHRLAFQVPGDDSRELFGSRSASSLPEHICQYYDTLEGHSFRPFMHQGIVWDGWDVDKDGEAINPFDSVEE